MTIVSMSDAAKALIALEEQRIKLYAQSADLTMKQIETMRVAVQKVKIMSNEQESILRQLDALERTSDAITGTVR